MSVGAVGASGAGIGASGVSSAPSIGSQAAAGVSNAGSVKSAGGDMIDGSINQTINNNTFNVNTNMSTMDMIGLHNQSAGHRSMNGLSAAQTVSPMDGAQNMDKMLEQLMKLMMMMMLMAMMQEMMGAGGGSSMAGG